jgi:single-stranded DNA-binding protein
VASVNRIILVGFVGAPSQLRYRTNGVAVTLFRLATDRPVPRQERAGSAVADWHTVEVEGGLGLARNDAARRASMLMRKGTEAYVEGSLLYRPKSGGVGAALEPVVLASRVEVLSQPLDADGPPAAGDGAAGRSAESRRARRKAPGGRRE